MGTSLQGWDEWLFYRINQGWQHPLLDVLMTVLSDKFTWFTVALLCFSVAYVKKVPRLYLLAASFFCALFLADSLSFRVIKPHIARLRPCYQLEQVRLLASRCGSDYGLPSNHAANAMAITTLAILVRPMWLSYLLIPLSVLVGLSRIYLGVHYPGDVLSGLGVGFLCGFLTWLGFRMLLKKHLKFPT